MGNGNTGASQVFNSLDEINFLLIIAVVIGAWLLINVSERVFPWLAGKVPNRFRLNILRLIPVLRLAILAVALVQIVLQIITPTAQNLFAIFGAAGLAIGFAFKDYVSSLIAGVVTIYERPYRPGDWVEIDGAYGEVRSIGLRTMNMVTPDDTVVTIPHAKIWDSNVYNSNTGQSTLMCVADFYLSPEHDAFAVRNKLREVALTSSYMQLERPVIVVLSEKPWGTHYRLKAYPVDGRQQFQFTSDLTARGKAALLEMGVEMAIEPMAYRGQG